MLKDHLQIGKLYSLHLWQGDKPVYCQMIGSYPEGSISVYHIKDLEYFCEVPYKNITVNPSHISMIRREESIDIPASYLPIIYEVITKYLCAKTAHSSRANNNQARKPNILDNFRYRNPIKRLNEG